MVLLFVTWICIVRLLWGFENKNYLYREIYRYTTYSDSNIYCKISSKIFMCLLSSRLHFWKVGLFALCISLSTPEGKKINNKRTVLDLDSFFWVWVITIIQEHKFPIKSMEKDEKHDLVFTWIWGNAFLLNYSLGLPDWVCFLAKKPNKYLI